ncbi:MAG: helix-turn-helix domain-containing protein, partial [Actinomycetota bacterium]|nr:helix-turn-helix domain-containing protein [Actinomycetota bacterium]
MAPDLDDPLARLCSLLEPVRRDLYRHVVECGGAVSRDEAAEALGISRSLAGYHLDKLMEAGLLDARFARRGDRTGPGAGRPAKLYQRSALELGVSVPSRSYRLAADLLAEAVAADASDAARVALERAARTAGRQ